MGNYWSASIFSKPDTDPDFKLLLLGLDAAGKTTLLHKLSSRKDVASTVPTIGFNVETLNVKGQVFTAWDVGGRGHLRALFRHYYPGTDAIVFVVDSNDPYRFDQARDELQRILQEKELESVPLLVFCNKQDLPNAVALAKIAERLELVSNEVHLGLVHRHWKCVPCTANKGEGVHEGLQWLFEAIRCPKQCSSTQHEEDGYLAAEEKDASHEDTGYVPLSKDGNLTLQDFKPIKNGTECPFAKSAVLWGGVLLSTNTGAASFSIEDQAKANVVLLVDFAKKVTANESLDGFCVQIQCPRPKTPAELGEYIRRFLTVISDEDPQKEGMMRVNYIGSRGWRFRFAAIDFFVTTFAPCYPSTSSRYDFGTGKTFLLLQPEASFLRHKLPLDTAITNDDESSGTMTVRDKTRVAFRKAGRSYYIPDTIHYPPAEHIVKPVVDDGSSLVVWWEAAQ